MVISLPLDKYSEVELLLGHMVLFHISWGTSILFSIVAAPVLIPTKGKEKKFPFLQILTSTGLFSFLFFFFYQGKARTLFSFLYEDFYLVIFPSFHPSIHPKMLIGTGNFHEQGITCSISPSSLIVEP